MFTSFNIKNFRCFANLKIDNLARVNLIAGKNNVGKTALLEAIFIRTGVYNPELAIRVNVFRGLTKMQIQLMQPAVGPWSPLFKDLDTSKNIVIDSELNGKLQTVTIQELSDPRELRRLSRTIKQNSDSDGIGSFTSTTDAIRVLQIEYINGKTRRKAHSIMDSQNIRNDLVPLPPFQTVFLTARGRIPSDEEANRFTKMTVNGKKELLVETLRILESRLTNLELLTFGGETIIHGHIGIGKPIPILLMGDGLSRLTSIVLAMSEAPNGVVLIDEIENGIHYSILKEMWKAIALAAREFNVQILLQHIVSNVYMLHMNHLRKIKLMILGIIG